MAPTTSSSFWDGIAEKYANKPIEYPAGFEDTLAIVGKYVTAESRVLEVGCGTGTAALRLAGGVGHVDATDYSAGLIAIAKRRQAEAEDAATNVAFRVADVAALGGEQSGAYDAVLAMNMLHLQDDAPRALAAIKHQLRPGGVLVSKTPALTNHLFYRLFIPVAQLFGMAPHVEFFSPDRITQLHADAGLDIVESKDYENGQRRLIVARKS